jgi:hypothetical protein
VQALLQPATAKRAGIAALTTTLLCLPRLRSWEERPTLLVTLLLALGVCSAVLWGFVFAWSPPSVRPVMRLRGRSGVWIGATAGGVLGALVLAGWIDPILRPLSPEDYAQSVGAWLVRWMFNLAMLQLFLCFAPVCFFYRLCPSPSSAIIATALFGVFLLGLQLQEAPPMALGFQILLVGVRAALGAWAALLFVRGGPWPVWWWSTLLQSRELLRLLTEI